MFIDDLKNHITKFSTTPFLFIGSGFSRRYLNMPAWEALLIDMNNRLGLPKQYEYYRANASNDLPKVASLMGADFNELWWSDEKYELSRNDFAKDAESKFSPLKYEICKRLNENVSIVSNELIDQEIRLLKKVNIDGVITTNWDNLIETQIFPGFKTYVGQDELIFSDLSNIGEIYKIHGSSDQPNSLILTEEDYQDYQNRNPYLAAKLLTIFIENPIIFIGYSLSDTNIQDILKAIIKCLSKDKITMLRDRLIFCQWDPECQEPSMADSTMLISDTIIPIKLINLSNYVDLFTVLANNMRRIPTKVLKHMKDMVCDFVKSTNSKQKIFIADSLENIENIHKAEFVWGIGLKDKLAEKGIKGIELKDILRDVVLNNHTDWLPLAIAKLALPAMAMRCRFIPYYKYLRNAGLLNQDGKIDVNSEIVEFSPGFIAKVNNIDRSDFLPSSSYQRKRDEINSQYDSIMALRQACKDNDLHMMMYIPLLSEEKISIDEFGDYLNQKINLIEDSRYGTHFRKLICLYDYIKYKKHV